MTVRFFPSLKKDKSSLIEGFLIAHHVKHELIDPTDEAYPKTWHRADEVPALEVDGRLFVDPNDDALRKIFRKR